MYCVCRYCNTNRNIPLDENRYTLASIRDTDVKIGYFVDHERDVTGGAIQLFIY